MGYDSNPISQQNSQCEPTNSYVSYLAKQTMLSEQVSPERPQNLKNNVLSDLNSRAHNSRQNPAQQTEIAGHRKSGSYTVQTSQKRTSATNSKVESRKSSKQSMNIQQTL